MKFEILLSTMNRCNFDILEKMNIKNNCLIINQTDFDSDEEIIKDGKKIRRIDSTTKGLSKSRNLALEKSLGEICILADDDLIYLDNMEKIILDAFDENKDYDLIAFQVEGIDKEFKKYPLKSKKINYISSMKISSVEIAFRRNIIIEKNICFNELLGSGAKYFMGEESEFLFRCIENGLKIKYIPLKIADLYVGNSTWFKGYNSDYFKSKGAAFTAMSKKMSLIFILQFAIRKYKKYYKTINMINAIKFMIIGKNMYLRELGED